MEVDAFGQVAGPAVAVIGAWDPVLPVHEELFACLVDCARERSMSSLVVVLDPNPVLFVQGRPNWPVYNDTRWRTHFILQAGVDGVLRLRCSERILEAGVEDLMDQVLSHAQITELWLGASQTLGRRESGNFATTARVMSEHGITVKRLAPSTDAYTGSHARRFIQAGHLTRAIDLVGRPPCWSAPAHRRAELAWCPGMYRAHVLADFDHRVVDEPLAIELQPEDGGMASFSWPENVAHLQFLSGPSDPENAG